ncbi:Na+/H+ antiporter NhaA [Croceivirga sp. JEA036]|uniref:Na+/H+ antiporter NhaA n=1 Tax=Croceivirga sp. JEA036 TaxID=2721162 RepID=UPI00143B5BB8|nr:Na+/H+ antiporter NhaA [Croceivirga sp. JEA036]NJB37966.1 Na+/H+ antiporter NhaA [Croceivirga sp. JEA036]
MFHKKPIDVVVYRNLKNKISAKAAKSLKDSLVNFGQEVTLHYKYAIDVSNPIEIYAVKAILAVREQNKEEALYQAIATETDLNEVKIDGFVRELDINFSAYQKEIQSNTLEKQVYAESKEAETAGVPIFPGITINGIPYKGPWDKESIIGALQKNGATLIRAAMQGLFKWGASAALALIIATIAALVLVNLGDAALYEQWRHYPIGFTFGTLDFTLTVEEWINDFFMAIFFLLIGLEIKEELIDGELSTRKKATLPVVAAIGGMLVPAVIYFFLNSNGEQLHGWGVPMATDIAFTLGLMAILGSRIPVSLKVFVSALAIADDLGAILIIALFYGHGFQIGYFLAALGVLLLMFYFNRKRVYNVSVYLILGLVLWFLVFKSGLHATLAGVLTALLIPAQGKANLQLIAKQTSIIFQKEIGEINNSNFDKKKIAPESLLVLKKAIERLREPSEFLLHNLEKFVNFIVLPLFAFFNTGIVLTAGDYYLLAPANIGIILGLCLGKPLGIVGFSWLATKLQWGKLAPEISWKSLIGAACLAGIGFTMSIVVASSAFTGQALTASKISILLASVIAASLGLGILYTATVKKSTLD